MSESIKNSTIFSKTTADSRLSNCPMSKFLPEKITKNILKYFRDLPVYDKISIELAKGKLSRLTQTSEKNVKLKCSNKLLNYQAELQKKIKKMKKLKYLLYYVQYESVESLMDLIVQSHVIYKLKIKINKIPLYGFLKNDFMCSGNSRKELLELLITPDLSEILNMDLVLKSNYNASIKLD